MLSICTALVLLTGAMTITGLTQSPALARYAARNENFVADVRPRNGPGARSAPKTIGKPAEGVLTGYQGQSPGPLLSVRGRVVAAETGTPLRRARVQSAATDNQPAVVVLTDGDGRFSVTVASDTVARLTVRKAGYLAMLFAIPRMDADVELRIPKAAVVSGRITSTAGEPVIGMTVSAEISGATEAERKIAATAETDDLGEYRLTGLVSGTYLVSIQMNTPLTGPSAAAINAFREHLGSKWYYPGTETIATAQPVVLGAGEDRSATDFRVPAPEPVDVVADSVSKAMPRGAGATRQPVPDADRGVIRGRVTTSDGRLASKAIVRLEINGQPARVPAALTDDEGRYEFQRLSSGTYTVVAVKSGNDLTWFGQERDSPRAERIDLRAAETRNDVDIALARPAAIAGRVLDDAGEAVEGATVHLLQIRFSQGHRRLVDAFSPFLRGTDDRGAYRIYGVPPGTYIVSARVGESSGSQTLLDLPGYPASYYPATANPAEAQPVTVGFRNDATSVDVTLVRAPTARVSGVALDSRGAPVATGLLLAPSRRSGVLAINPVTASVARDGRFEFANVTAGEYVIQANKGRDDPFDEGESVSQFVAVGTTDITDLVVRASRGSTFKGRLVFEGSAPSERPGAPDLQAVPVDMDRTPQTLESPASARLEADNTFEMAGLTGPRLFRLPEGTRNWTLKAVLLNGRDVTDTPLPAGTAAQSISGLEVVLTNRISRVGGMVLDNRGHGVADATVIVFSTDRSSWTETSRFLATVNSEKNGSFVVSNLPPGDYYAAALIETGPGESRDPDLLNTLVPNATQVTVLEGETVDTQVHVIAR